MSIIHLLFQVNFPKRDANLILICQILLIHAIEITPQKMVYFLLIIVTLGKLYCGLRRQRFESGNKNGINRPSLHGTKLRREFPRKFCLF